VKRIVAHRSTHLEEIRFLAVSFESLEDLQRERESLSEEVFTLCSDPERSAYAAFGLQRARLRNVLGWKTMLYYAQHLLRGEIVRSKNRTERDIYQLGGNFILDRNGCLRLSFRSQEPADRPLATEEVRILEECLNDGS